MRRVTTQNRARYTTTNTSTTAVLLILMQRRVLPATLGFSFRCMRPPGVIIRSGSSKAKQCCRTRDKDDRRRHNQQ